jgi:OHCU decarboxylase
MVQVFRAADEDERLAVLQAHPDLAGRLDAAERLTDASAEEQASAGLDALTAAEHQRFTELNQAYTEKFGFPFIIAVKDNTKASILKAFEARLKNERDIEFATACKQVERIAYLRLASMLPE